MQVSIRRLSPDSREDMDQWRGLYRIVFGREYPEQVWEWKYLENPYNDADGPLIYVAEADSRIVGARSLLPSVVAVSYGQRMEWLKACQFNNAMVHPDFRHGGVFTKITTHSIEDARRRGYKIAYGYPNHQSLPGHIKMGCTYLGRLRRCAMLINVKAIVGDYLTRRGVPRFAQKAALPIAEIAVSLALPGEKLGHYRLEHGPVQRFAEEIASLHLSDVARQGIYGQRSIEFLAWRFRRPDRDYRCYALYESDRMAGYLAAYINAVSQSASILDIYAPGWNRQILARLLRGTLEHLKGQSCSSLQISLLDRTWPLKALFSPRHAVWRTNLNVHLIAYSLSEEIDPVLFRDRGNWYLQQADQSPF
ncbi:MAG: GNAT family N-acetyltransferase [Dehalococcoidia bacterium]|nr:GNAT family N-acetyltransferase [Dehalococcoidia bacterium]